MNDWISAGIAIAAGIVIGLIAARLLRRFIHKQPSEAIQTVAVPLSSLVLATFVITGLVVGLGFVQPDAVDQIRDDLISFLPRAFGAAIVLIGANVAASLVSEAVRRVVSNTPMASGVVAGGARAAILVAGAILAASQLGFDTTIITLAAAALLFALAGAFILIVGLGGREVASEVAAGRTWRSMIEVGMQIRVGDDTGVISAIHPVAVEIDADGRRVLIPHSRILAEGLDLVD